MLHDKETSNLISLKNKPYFLLVLHECCIPTVVPLGSAWFSPAQLHSLLTPDTGLNEYLLSGFILSSWFGAGSRATSRKLALCHKNVHRSIILRAKERKLLKCPSQSWRTDQGNAYLHTGMLLDDDNHWDTDSRTLWRNSLAFSQPVFYIGGPNLQPPPCPAQAVGELRSLRVLADSWNCQMSQVPKSGERRSFPLLRNAFSSRGPTFLLNCLFLTGL